MVRIVTHDPMRTISVFLAYVAVLAALSTWQGIRALRARRGRRTVFDVALPLLLAMAGAGVAIFGLAVGQGPLYGFFGGVGILLAFVMLRYWLRPPTTPMAWFFEHMGSMIGASTAALTAFAVVNAPRFGFGRLVLGFWIAPTLVLTPLGLLWRRSYARRFAAADARRAASADARQAAAARTVATAVSAPSQL
jgi:hypothetical protein